MRKKRGREGIQGDGSAIFRAVREDLWEVTFEQSLQEVGNGDSQQLQESILGSRKNRCKP